MLFNVVYIVAVLEAVLVRLSQDDAILNDLVEAEEGGEVNTRKEHGACAGLVEYASDADAVSKCTWARRRIN